MSQLSLSEYKQEIAEQIENGYIDEAIAHCRHVLSRYPRCLAAYKLLAYACLEKGDFAHANHFFQCVLSANLEDAEAWVSLALLAEDIGETEQAIWLLERAFEASPGDTRVREMLRQLYMQRDGSERTRIKLTPTALARLYARGGFYQRAIRELEKILQESSSLTRLQVAALEVSLAKALWNTEDRASLADPICESLLHKVPSSLQANLILGDIRANAGRHQEAEPYLQIARMLDPEGELAYELLGYRSPLPRSRVEVPRLDYKAPQLEEAQAAVPEAEDTSWLDRIGESIEPLALEDEQEAPEWIKDWVEKETLMTTPVDQEPLEKDKAATGRDTAPLGAEPETDELEIPDWLREMQRESSRPDADEDVPDWLQDLPAEDGQEATEETDLAFSPEDELPDWLQELEPTESVEASEQTIDQPTLKDDLPDWLLELSQAETLETDVVPETTTEDELAEWPLEREPLSPPEQIQPEKATKPLRIPAVAEDTVQPAEEELSEWFDELRQEAEVAAFTESAQEVDMVPAAESPAQGEIPDWLRELSAEGEMETPDVHATATAEPPMPPQAAAEPLAAAELASEQESQEESLLGATVEGLPNWLRELEAEISGAEGPAARAPAPQPQVEEPPIAVTRMTEPAAVSPERPVEIAPEAAPEAALEPAREGDMPDWLKELQRADETTEAVSSVLEQADLDRETLAVIEPTSDEELPDWLRELRAEAELSEVISPAFPEDEIDSLAGDALEPVLDEELPDWLQQLRPAGEPQPGERPTLEAKPVPAPVTQPLPPMEETVEAVSAPTDEMEDMEWLRELEQAAEVEVPAVEKEPSVPPSIVPTPEAERVDRSRVTAPVKAPPPDVPEPPFEPAAVRRAPLEETPVFEAQDTEGRLAWARKRLSENVPDDSAQEYEQLVLEPGLAQELVGELEEAVRTHPDHHALQRVLGDAYMRAGQLQKALQAYQQALSKL
jgi:tetratricopeptide (TPR) repeat protein